MYLTHFNLKKKPFDLTPDPEFLHFSSKHKMAFSLLQYGVFEQTGITVLTGEIGCGKTTLIRRLISTIEDNQFMVGLINNTHESLGDLSIWIAHAFGINHKDKDQVELFQCLQNYFIEQYSKGLRALLIVDEAQNMSATSLEKLRLFTNINSEQDVLFQILLVGQPELSNLLAQSHLSQIAQRVSVEYHITPLNWVETKDYVFHRLAIAGAQSPIFNHEAIGIIFYYSGGIPRLINTLCDYALVYAYAMGSTKVDLHTAFESLKDRKISGVNRFIKFTEETEKVRKMLQQSTGLDIAKLA